MQSIGILTPSAFFWRSSFALTITDGYFFVNQRKKAGTPIIKFPEKLSIVKVIDVTNATEIMLRL